VSSKTTQLLQTGDSLAFLFSDSSYVTYATGMGMPAYPGSVSFTFASSPLSVPGQFTAKLESVDGTVYSAIPSPIDWSTGYAQSSAYSGSISDLVGSFTLSSAISQALFSNPEAELILTYSGPNVTVGMPGNNLEHDLMVSLSGGPLSIGGTVYSASFDGAGGGLLASGFRSAAVTVSSAAPEPSSGLLFFAAGTAFCLLAGALKRFARRRAMQNALDQPAA